jgi:nuclear transport factor 2 (NTF2) superfamily protein
MEFHSYSMTAISEQRPPIPPFNLETATLKVRKAEDAWNTRKPIPVSLAYSTDSKWRNRAEFITGRDQIVAFLTRKWDTEQEYRLIKELWAFTEDRIAVRFAYEWINKTGDWIRSYGNENWKFDADGLMCERHASINDLPIKERDRLFLWNRSGPRPSGHAGLTALTL